MLPSGIERGSHSFSLIFVFLSQPYEIACSVLLWDNTTMTDQNLERKSKNLGMLNEAGWRVLVLWQCELKNIDKLKTRLHEFIEAK